MLRKLGFCLAMATTPAFGQDLYDIDNITLIEITFQESDWDAIMDANNLADLGEKLKGTVVINGSSYDSVGVAYKGNSSYSASNAKNPLNIELNYDINQRYQGYETLKLASGKNDPSFVREVLSYEIGRKYMDMPLSNYAKVYINGTYYGLFSSSEAVDGRYGERRIYANSNNPRFKCNPPNGMGPGNEPSLDFLGTDSALYANIYELKSTYGWLEFIDFLYQLETNSANIETYLDLDRALWMLAFNNVTGNMDSYSGPTKQNYYMFQADNGRWVPIIWDLNEGIGGFENTGGGPPSLAGITDLDIYSHATDANWPLIKQLLSIPRYKKMYLAHMKTIVEENLSNNWYYTRAQELQTIIDAEVQAEPNNFYPYTDFISNLDNTVAGMSGAYGIAEVMNGREAFITAHADYSLVAPTITPQTTSPAVVPANTLVNFTADIQNATYAYLGYRSYTGDIFQKLQLYDDGAHGDGAAGDGIWGVSVFAGAEDLQYYFYAENANAAKFSPVRAEHEFYDLIIESDVVINELMPKNNVTATDEEGKYEDWIELYNNSASAVDLSGYYLSDDFTNPNKWTFPAGTSIAANGYLIVWCDQDTLATSGLHTNFKLTSGGETLILSNASGFSVNQVSYPEIESSSTYGRYPNGTGECMRMVPTHNASNSYSAIGVEELAETTFSIYPNPASDHVYVVTGEDQPVDFSLFDINGRLIYSGQVENNSAIDISALEKGTYLVYLPGLQKVQKLVKN
jgi:hypothetical protein